MSNVEAVSADFARKIVAAEGDNARVLDIKTEWSVWRDSLSIPEKIRSVYAFTAAEIPMSEGALKLLKDHNPEAYDVYRKVYENE